MGVLAALSELEAVRSETFAAAERTLEAVDAALALIPDVRRADGAAVDALQQALCDILEHMSFQDITGQRLSRVVSLLGDAGTGAHEEKLSSEFSLENGPALPGGGLSQGEADSLLRNDGA